MVEVRRGGGRGGEGEGGGAGEETDIKSNNPHLTGGELNNMSLFSPKHAHVTHCVKDIGAAEDLPETYAWAPRGGW